MLQTDSRCAGGGEIPIERSPRDYVGGDGAKNLRPDAAQHKFCSCGCIGYRRILRETI